LQKCHILIYVKEIFNDHSIDITISFKIKTVGSQNLLAFHNKRIKLDL